MATCRSVRCSPLHARDGTLGWPHELSGDRFGQRHFAAHPWLMSEKRSAIAAPSRAACSRSRATSSCAWPPSLSEGALEIDPIPHTRAAPDRGALKGRIGWRWRGPRYPPRARIVAGDGAPMRSLSARRRTGRTRGGSGLPIRSNVRCREPAGESRPRLEQRSRDHRTR